MYRTDLGRFVDDDESNELATAFVSRYLMKEEDAEPISRTVDGAIFVLPSSSSRSEHIQADAGLGVDVGAAAAVIWWLRELGVVIDF